MAKHELQLWRMPRWSAYVAGVGLSIGICALRTQLDPWMGNAGRVVFMTLPVALAAMIGGLRPGLLATVLSVVLSYLYLIPTSSLSSTESIVHVVSFAAVWTFISIMAGQFRGAAESSRAAAVERDAERDRLASVLSSVSDGFFVVDHNWRIQYTNSAFHRMVGFGSERLQGMLLSELYNRPTDATSLEMLRQAKRDNKTVAFDVQDPYGADRWVHVRGFPNDEGMFVYIQDVTARKHLEAERERLLADERRARSDAEQASRLKDEFVATLSHELRTPLTTILGWSEILRKRASADERFSEGLQAIDRSTRLQVQLIDDLLDMSRISTGKLRLQVEILDLHSVVDEAVEANRPAATNRDIDLRLVVQAEESFVRGDASRLSQVMSNLVGNAIKFTPHGGRVDVTVSHADSTAVVKIEDTGEGIDPLFLPHIFDRFRQGNASITRRHGGLGLGLSIVRQLVELHGGSVSADSRGKGQGSTFIVRLPLATLSPPAKETSLSHAAEALDVEEVRLDGAKVLVVDDDEAARDLLTLIISEAGGDVVSVGSATEALSTLLATRPDVLLSDIGMPDVDGYQLIRRVRGGEVDGLRSVPAVALTAFAREQDRKQAIDAGYDMHLSKPIDPGRLLWTLQNVRAIRQ